MIKTIGFVCFTVVVVGIAVGGVDAFGWGSRRSSAGRDKTDFGSDWDLGRQKTSGSSRFSFRTSARAVDPASTPRCLGRTTGENGGCNSRQSANSWNRNSLKTNPNPQQNRIPQVRVRKSLDRIRSGTSRTATLGRVFRPKYDED